MFLIAILLLLLSLLSVTFSGNFKHLQEGNDYSGTVKTFGIVSFVFALVLGFSSLVRIVPAGHVGVVDLWGRVDDQVRKSGINLVNPFVNLVIMDIQTQELKE